MTTNSKSRRNKTNRIKYDSLDKEIHVCVCGGGGLRACGRAGGCVCVCVLDIRSISNGRFLGAAAIDVR